MGAGVSVWTGAAYVTAGTDEDYATEGPVFSFVFFYSSGFFYSAAFFY